MSAKDSLTSKCVVVCGLLRDKTCLCEKCRSSGISTSLPDGVRDQIMQRFHEQIRMDRLEKLGTYAQNFGDNKIRRNGDQTVYARSIVIRGEHFSVAYKLCPMATTPRTGDGRGDVIRTNNNQDKNVQARLHRQMSQG